MTRPEAPSSVPQRCDLRVVIPARRGRGRHGLVDHARTGPRFRAWITFEKLSRLLLLALRYALQ